jgi:thiamine-phosphate pyrophosphorylase
MRRPSRKVGRLFGRQPEARPAPSPAAAVAGLHVVVASFQEAQAAVLAGADVVRLAASDGVSAAEAGRGLRALGSRFYVVDDIAAALELGADGVHLDRHPERAEAVRAVGLRLGMATTVTPGVAADYVDFGRVGESVGGDGAFTSWLLSLSRTVTASGAPVIASGDLDAANAAACVAAGAVGIAIRGVPRDDALRRALDVAVADRLAAGPGRLQR